jgi:hypothetical protein
MHIRHFKDSSIVCWLLNSGDSSDDVSETLLEFFVEGFCYKLLF